MRSGNGKKGTCDFCGKDTDDTQRMFSGLQIEGTKLRPMICIECVELAMDIQRDVIALQDEFRRLGT